MTASKKQISHNVRILRRERKELYKLGATTLDLVLLERWYTLIANRPRSTLADLGRIMGVSRQCVHQHFQRLCRIGLIHKLHRGYLLIGKKLRKAAADADLARREHAKRLRSLKIMKSVKADLTHIREDCSLKSISQLQRDFAQKSLAEIAKERSRKLLGLD